MQLEYLQNGKSYSYPSQRYLARFFECSIRTIGRSIARLKKLGILRVQSRKYKRKDGTFATTTNLYQIVNGRISQKLRAIFYPLTDKSRKAEKKVSEYKRKGLEPSFSTQNQKRDTETPKRDTRPPEIVNLESLKGKDFLIRFLAHAPEWAHLQTT